MKKRFSFFKHYFVFFIIFFFVICPVFALETPDLFRGVQKEVLPNGLTIISLKNDGLPIVSINFFVNTGSINEDDRNSGVSHFCEHMFYRGTDERSGTKMKMEVENLGGSFNAETSKDYTRFYVNVPSEYGLEVLKIYCDALLNANYEEDKLAQERQVILEEYNLTKESPAHTITEKIFKMGFSSHPYCRPVIGTENTIKNLSRSDLTSYKSRWYTPGNISVVIVGNFDKDKYLGFLRSYFANMKGSSIKDCPVYPQEPQIIKREIEEKKPYLGKKAYFTMAYRSPGIDTPEDVLAMDLLIFMLGQGENSFFNKELVKNRRLVDYFGADYLTMKEPGLILFSTEIEPEKIEFLKEGIQTVLFKIKSGKFEEAEVEKARNLLVKTYIFGAETNEGKADALGFYQMLDDYAFAVNYIDRIKKVNKDDLVRVAKKYLDGDYVLYVMKPEPKKKND